MNEAVDACLPGFFTYVTLTSNNGKIHIAEKPESLMVDILGITATSATVLDPFMGSDTTGVACGVTGRNFIGIEINDKYFALAQKRIAKAQGKPPLLTLPTQQQAQMFGEHE